MNELLAVAMITILAVISPGPDFAMITRNSYAYGRRSGLISALGVALGVQLHVLYTVLGIAVVIAHSPVLFLVMKFLGAGYLIYIGYRSLTNKSRLTLDLSTGHRLGMWVAFRNGFLTNALNPKTMLFVVSSYTQIVKPGSPLAIDFAYGAFMSLAHLAWFSLVAIFFSSEVLRQAMLERQRIVDRIIGTALIALGLSLAFTAVGFK
ncbi:LysE family translocator [Paraburkholderia megapolitana]|uniref:Resistance to homoserine/threonine (RhtB) family protein n=1 Tax=Paraburkholderia megapolitana TaxID=420953 RepID=A0A1I3RPE5_9BURK|nr:LysE family transporter [Paraburkholderia megapolitana]QDQ83982.1 LysE family translocator [Paraburkholderia megapolitana]SFJ48128.1 resistance to homoserine/threonine (RhtB) family protein [Paraburkholderia megapolitana]